MLAVPPSVFSLRQERLRRPAAVPAAPPSAAAHETPTTHVHTHTRARLPTRSKLSVCLYTHLESCCRSQGTAAAAAAALSRMAAANCTTQTRPPSMHKRHAPTPAQQLLPCARHIRASTHTDHPAASLPPAATPCRCCHTIAGTPASAPAAITGGAAGCTRRTTGR